MPTPESSMDDDERSGGIDRRTFVGVLAALGIPGGVSSQLLWARFQQEGDLTTQTIAEAEKLAGVSFTPEEREMMLERLADLENAYRVMRATDLSNDVLPAIVFDPLPAGRTVPAGESYVRASIATALPDPAVEVDLAFASIVQLGTLLRERSVTSTALTRMYLDRLRRFDPMLECSVTTTDELALEQADRADRELDAGDVRGALHGIPWGAKDLLATRGYPTTWGAAPFRDQAFDYDATVVTRLEEAGAVLVSKLALGALAMGDEWFGGRTRNPWNPAEGSGGSSAGSASATAAGLVGFSIGSETFGSIIAPATRCGATGLRPTFGRVSRHGAMSLSWSMDKLGPICRSAEDCALVFAAIQGPDGRDRTVRTAPFAWDGSEGLEGIRIGYLQTALFDNGGPNPEDVAVLGTLSQAGAELVPVSMPMVLPIPELLMILDTEASAAFDEFVRTDSEDQLAGQDPGSWPNVLRTARFVPAVEYLRANRIRSLLIESFEALWGSVDVVVAPTASSNLILATNLTGHPCVVLPHGWTQAGSPVSILFVGGLYKEAEALRVANVFQRATDHHLRRPPTFS